MQCCDSISHTFKRSCYLEALEDSTNPIYYIEITALKFDVQKYLALEIFVHTDNTGLQNLNQ